MELQKPAGASQPDGCTENVSDRTAVRGPEDDARGRQKIKFPKWELENARTSELVAKEHRMGKRSVLRAAKFSKGVDAAEKIESSTRKNILIDEGKVTHVIRIAYL